MLISYYILTKNKEMEEYWSEKYQRVEEEADENAAENKPTLTREYFDMFQRVNRFSIEMVINSGFFILVLMTNMYFIGTV